jgi:hypothetical protein
MNDQEFAEWLERVKQHDPEKIAAWAAKQPPLLASLDQRDAEDRDN